jgi:hypothetical protein
VSRFQLGYAKCVACRLSLHIKAAGSRDSIVLLSQVNGDHAGDDAESSEHGVAIDSFEIAQKDDAHE